MFTEKGKTAPGTLAVQVGSGMNDGVLSRWGCHQLIGRKCSRQSGRVGSGKAINLYIYKCPLSATVGASLLCV